MSELEIIARAKAQELGPDLHVVSSDGMVRVPTVGSSGGLPDANAARTKHYPSQSAKSLLQAFFEHNPPTRLDATHQTTIFRSRPDDSICQGCGLRSILGVIWDVRGPSLKTNLIGRVG